MREDPEWVEDLLRGCDAQKRIYRGHISGGATATQLAARLEMNADAVLHAIRRMVVKGLFTRHQSVNDLREKLYVRWDDTLGEEHKRKTRMTQRDLAVLSEVARVKKTHPNHLRAVLDIEPSFLNHILERLCAKGFITRDKPPGSRKRAAEITPKGLAALNGEK